MACTPSVELIDVVMVSCGLVDLLLDSPGRDCLRRLKRLCLLWLNSLDEVLDLRKAKDWRRRLRRLRRPCAAVGGSGGGCDSISAGAGDEEGSTEVGTSSKSRTEGRGAATVKA